MLLNRGSPEFKLLSRSVRIRLWLRSFGPLIATAIFTLGVFISLYFIAFAAYNKANNVETRLKTVEKVINRTVVIKGSKAVGPPGPRGLPGRNGRNGKNGAHGLQGARGAQGKRGPRGVRGATGARGARGAKGAKGLRGAVGPVGATSTSTITIRTVTTPVRTVTTPIPCIKHVIKPC